MKNKTNVYISIIAIMIMLISIIGTSFSYLDLKETMEDKKKITDIITATLSIKYKETSTINIQAAMQGDTIIKEFAINNNANTEVPFELSLIDIKTNFTNNDDITYNLLKDNEEIITGENLLTKTTISNLNIKPYETNNYSLIININSLNTENTELRNYESKIKISHEE